MMIYIFYSIFMIPMVTFCNSFILFQLSLIFMLILFMTNFIDYFYSSISYNLGIDNISFTLILLSLIIVSLMVMSMLLLVGNKFFKSLFLMICLILLLILILIFCSLNMFIMFMYFEFSLIPLIMLIFGWGYQPERLISGLYLFFYTIFASMPLLFLIAYFYTKYNSLFFDFNLNFTFNFVINLCLTLAFLVKLPMFMLHFWLPKAHVQAPISGSMILAGLFLKIGGYGIVRFMFIHEYLFFFYSHIWYTLSITGGVLVSMICFIQGDIKSLIAYSSISHMSMCLAGMLSMTKWGVLGSYFIMISHGLCSSALFCLANISYERLLSRSFYLNKGLLIFMPSMTLFWFMFSIFNMGCPPSLNFISELIILNSMISYWPTSFVYFILISFFGSCFSFYLFSYTQHGQLNFFYSYMLGTIREYLLLIVHLFPVIFIIMGLNNLGF
nr:NADH dehydrogenase subunit 4 [Elbelus tripunctatus]